MASLDWTGRRALVTGAGGFIGSHLCERLLAMGAQVRALAYGDPGGGVGYLACVPPQLAKGLETHVGDIRDGVFVREMTAGVDTVFHLAALSSVPFSYSNPAETILTNVETTVNICNACRYEGVRRLVHTSSATVYGTAEKGMPTPETHPVRAYNPYTASKLASDHIVESFHHSYDLPVGICRIFNVYGPRAGRFLVIPSIILQLLRGNRVTLGDLTPKRSFTYVDDIVEAFIRMAEEDEVIGQVVNFGSDRTISVGDLAHLIARLMEKEIIIVSDPQRFRPEKSEIYFVLADRTKARKLLGWAPQVELEEGLKKTIDWIAAGGYNRVGP